MKRKLKFYATAIITCSCLKLFAQVPPSLDPNWMIDTMKSDEFNGSTLNSSKWDKGYLGCGWGWGYGSHLSN